MECYLNLQVKSKRTLTQVFPLNFVNFFIKYKALLQSNSRSLLRIPVDYFTILRKTPSRFESSYSFIIAQRRNAKHSILDVCGSPKQTFYSFSGKFQKFIEKVYLCYEKRTLSRGFSLETGVHRCSSKQVLLKISRYSQENTCVGVSFQLNGKQSPTAVRRCFQNRWS